MFRSRSNCMVIFPDPVLLFDVISVIPAMRPKVRSSGVVTAEAIVSGLAPGRFVNTLIVGYSTCGSGATGRKKNPSAPAIATASARSDVATGLLMNGVEILIGLAVAIPPALLPRSGYRFANRAIGKRFDQTSDTRLERCKA